MEEPKWCVVLSCEIFFCKKSEAPFRVNSVTTDCTKWDYVQIITNGIKGDFLWHLKAPYSRFWFVVGAANLITVGRIIPPLLYLDELFFFRFQPHERTIPQQAA